MCDARVCALSAHVDVEVCVHALCSLGGSECVPWWHVARGCRPRPPARLRQPLLTHACARSAALRRPSLLSNNRLTFISADAFQSQTQLAGL